MAEPRDADRHRLPIAKRYLVPGHAGKQPPLYGAPALSAAVNRTRAESAGLTRGSLPDAAWTTAHAC